MPPVRAAARGRVLAAVGEADRMQRKVRQKGQHWSGAVQCGICDCQQRAVLGEDPSDPVRRVEDIEDEKSAAGLVHGEHRRDQIG